MDQDRLPMRISLRCLIGVLFAVMPTCTLPFQDTKVNSISLRCQS